MFRHMSRGAQSWSNAMTAAALFAVDPLGTGGICVRAGPGPVRDGWLAVLRSCFPSAVSFRKLPPAISDERLLGGLDLAATLHARRPVVQRGLLADADGGVLLAVMAERLSSATVAHLIAAIDRRQIDLERDGMSRRSPSRFGLVAFDEGLDDERASAALSDRLAFQLDLQSLSRPDVTSEEYDVDNVIAARRRLPRVDVEADAVEALCHAAGSLGIASLRAPLLALRVAVAAAAFDDDEIVRRDHLELAARLVLSPRATALPASPEQDAEMSRDQDPETIDDRQDPEVPIEDLVLEAAKAAIPPNLFKQLQGGSLQRPRTMRAGKQGLSKAGPRRGRAIGVRRGEFGAGNQLNLLETLRAAAPWQPLRRAGEAGSVARLLIRKEDFRIKRFKQRSASSTIFVVDASGSSALQRLAEVKGAVELLLADCYIRRDEVALIAFRGRTAQLILPPTRSLTRVRRSLAALAGGGGTPLAAAIDSATTLAVAVRNKGQSPLVVLMTDGRANVARDGCGGRAGAEIEAYEAARQFCVTGIPAVVVDTSPRPQPQAEKIAAEMKARYVALPYADATRLSRVVQANMAVG
ncbi:magnesium chelatase subunit D [Bradyrhizobium guangzhouense]|uniref:magnesium chelatase subunit D n=1 Tax=Bradyrhizobium guangzhouense TaxID=1325095 RepID=UPI003D320BBD